MGIKRKIDQELRRIITRTITKNTITLVFFILIELIFEKMSYYFTEEYKGELWNSKKTTTVEEGITTVQGTMTPE